MDVITLATGSTGNCYFVKDVNGKTIILDCGISFQEITHHQDFPKFSDIEFVFVSHIHWLHKDHSKSMKDFYRSGCEMLTYEMLEPKLQSREFPHFRVKLFAVKHNCLNFGIIIQSKETGEKLCYMTDFFQAPMVEGIDTFIFEVNYIDAFIDEMIDENKDLKHLGFNNHCSLEYATEYFTNMKTRPKKIYCCHGSKSHSIKKRIYEGMKQFADEVVVL